MPESRDSRDSRDAVDEVARTPEHPVADDRASRQRIEVTHGASVVPVPPAPDVRPPGPEGAYVGQPAKVMRIGTMVKQLLEEVRSAPLDEAARSRLAAVHDRSLRELEDGLSPDLVAELRRITLPFSDETNPSESELRVAQAQLVGWLEGLFHGLQTALVAQQMSTQAQLAQMRRALPAGSTERISEDDDGEPGRDDRKAPGQYL